MLASNEDTNQSEILPENTSPPVVSTINDIIPSTNRQHLSRLSQFQRNTIHLCDQIHEHA